MQEKINIKNQIISAVLTVALFYILKKGSLSEITLPSFVALFSLPLLFICFSCSGLMPSLLFLSLMFTGIFEKLGLVPSLMSAVYVLPCFSIFAYYSSRENRSLNDFPKYSSLLLIAHVLGLGLAFLIVYLKLNGNVFLNLSKQLMLRLKASSDFPMYLSLLAELGFISGGSISRLDLMTGLGSSKLEMLSGGFEASLPSLMFIMLLYLVFSYSIRLCYFYSRLALKLNPAFKGQALFQGLEGNSGTGAANEKTANAKSVSPHFDEFKALLQRLFSRLGIKKPFLMLGIVFVSSYIASRYLQPAGSLLTLINVFNMISLSFLSIGGLYALYDLLSLKFSSRAFKIALCIMLSLLLNETIIILVFIIQRLKFKED